MAACIFFLLGFVIFYKKRYKLEIDSVGGKDNKINFGEIKGIKYKKDKINKGEDKKGKKDKRDSKKTNMDDSISSIFDV